MINAAQLAAMTGAAQKARAAVRFQLLTDEKTGVKIGAPLKILEKRTANDAGGSRLMKADGSIVLDLSSVAGGDAKLAMLFAALTAEAPGRKITLKINRPDFFVVSGEEGGRKIYERMAKHPKGIRTASSLSDAEVLASHDRHAGDLAAMASELGVSRKGLAARVRDVVSRSKRR